MATPSAVGRQLSILLGSQSLEAVQHAMGGAGKKAATDAVKADLGNDLRMSNMRSKAKLSSGYDLERDGSVVLHLRPAGLWNLADKGRRRSGRIRPRRRRALTTPKGPRHSAHFGPSRGLSTIDDAIEKMAIEVPKAADKAVAEIVAGI